MLASRWLTVCVTLLAFVAGASTETCIVPFELTEGVFNEIQDVRIRANGIGVPVSLSNEVSVTGVVNSVIEVDDGEGCPTSAEGWLELQSRNPTRLTTEGTDGLLVQPNPFTVEIEGVIFRLLLGSDLQFSDVQLAVEGVVQPDGTADLLFEVQRGFAGGIDLSDAGSAVSRVTIDFAESEGEVRLFVPELSVQVSEDDTGGTFVNADLFLSLELVSDSLQETEDVAEGVAMAPAPAIMP